MKKLMFFAAFLLVVSCNNKRYQHVLSPLDDSINKEMNFKDSVERSDSIRAAREKARATSPFVLYNYDMGNGKHRIFYQVRNKEGYYQIYTRMSDDNTKKSQPIKTPYERYEDFYFYTNGAPDPYFYKVSPDGTKLYVVTDINPCADGAFARYQLFRIDCRTLKAKIVAECAAIEATENGFKVAQGRVTNEETASCVADEICVVHDEFLDWNGHVVSKSSKEYDWGKMIEKYQTPGDDCNYILNFDETIKYPTLK